MINEIEDGEHPNDQTGPHLNDEDGGGSAGGIILKKGPWTSAEDAILVDYVKKHGEGNWNAVQKHSGLSRCGKSCRLRWANHLRPNLKKGAFTADEEQMIAKLHAKMGNKWARMAAHVSILSIFVCCTFLIVTRFLFREIYDFYLPLMTSLLLYLVFYSRKLLSDYFLFFVLNNMEQAS